MFLKYLNSKTQRNQQEEVKTNERKIPKKSRQGKTKIIRNNPNTSQKQKTAKPT